LARHFRLFFAVVPSLRDEKYFDKPVVSSTQQHKKVNPRGSIQHALFFKKQAAPLVNPFLPPHRSQRQ